MTTLKKVLLTTLLLITASGCNPKAPDATNSNKQDSAVEKAGRSFASKPTDSVQSKTKGQDSDANNPAVELAGSADQNDSGATKPAKVDHNDPTSYPVTVLPEKSESQLACFSWNIESDGADSELVASQLKQFNSGNRYDLIALTEVLPQNFKVMHAALGWDYRYAYGKTGRNDRMQILFNVKRFKEVRHFELRDINVNGRYRAPLVVHLKQLENGREFLVMVNHLARGKAEIRQEQATMLVEWAREQTLPVVALGDYNFDFVFETEKGNPSFTNFMRDDIWQWSRPIEWVDTNWYDNPEKPDGKDDYPGSMLDFAFVAGQAKEWKSLCNVIVTKDDFPDGKSKSDHRPFEVLYNW